MKEYDLIKKLFGDVPDLFASDAQFFDAGNQRFGITCDTFSEEDMFTTESPERLGRNLVIATLSDLRAAACAPAFYMHSISFPRDVAESWASELARGIRDELAQNRCALIGGDTGSGATFSYTGIAWGPQTRPLSRIIPDAPQHLYVSGKLGALNAAILAGVPTPSLFRRDTPPAATACIDTSGGFMDALWQLHTLNPNHRFDVANVPADDIALLFGGAGEYELLYTAPEAESVCIGTVTPGKCGVFLDGAEIKTAPPDPRDFATLDAYILAIRSQLHELFG